MCDKKILSHYTHRIREDRISQRIWFENITCPDEKRKRLPGKKSVHTTRNYPNHWIFYRLSVADRSAVAFSGSEPACPAIVNRNLECGTALDKETAETGGQTRS